MMISSPTPDLTVALLAYEEGPNLALLLPKLHETLGPLNIAYELVVVDSEQPHDDTPQICARNHTRYLPQAGGSNFGAAVRTAFAASQGRWVMLMDADGSHAPEYAPELWAHHETADLVVASRYIPGGGTENTAMLIVLSKILNATFRLLLGLSCTDVSGSFRLYRGDDIRALKLECKHFDIAEEIIVKLCAANPGYQITEIPYTFKKRIAGKTKRGLTQFALSYLLTLGRLWRLKRQIK